MIRFPGRILRGAVAILNVIVLDQAMITGPWAVANAIIATYLMFTAVSGECVVREYLIRPIGPLTGKENRYVSNSVKKL